eukprot:scaffold5706_cov151-Cylindrotheca_fusiformis.AAC.5
MNLRFGKENTRRPNISGKTRGNRLPHIPLLLYKRNKMKTNRLLASMTHQSSGVDDGQSESSKKSQITQQSSYVSSGGGSASNRSGSESGSGSGSGIPAPQQVHVSPIVGKQEEANVLKARGLVAFILLLAVAGVATTANLLVKQQEQNDFENQFAGHATEILTVSRSAANQFFDAMDSFASSIGVQAATEHAYLNTSWPFYRIPQWSKQAQKLAHLTGVNDPFVGVAPIVHEDEREQWNNFAAEQNPIWYQESIENEGYTDMTAKQLVEMTIPFTYYYDNNSPKPVTRPGDVVPYFQSYPVGPPMGLPLMLTNIDALLSSQKTAEVFRITNTTRRPAIGFTRIRTEFDTEIPGSQIVQPIYDGADTEAEDRKMVAIILIQIPWLDYFKNVLAEGEDGLIVVLESACPKVREDGANPVVRNPTESERNMITYRVDGPNAVLLGEDDLHDPTYDSLGVSEIFVDLQVDHSKLPEGSCVPILTLHVYPSAELEDSFKTDNDITYTVVVVVIFAFTTLVFLLYDFSVGKRQRIVMDRIAKQDKIVSDVFPTAIRDRLYENQEKNKMGGDADLLDDGPFGLDETFAGRSNAPGSAPLADLFPSVTVVFADLVGFTAWSSAREPHQVFILLETLYGAFDKIAYRHGVFKVETVGDCYVAAAGLPEPTDDHAVVACRFARDCLKKMKDVTLKLEVSLGPDTSDLDLRTGIHR